MFSQLEKERSELITELAAMKTKLADAEKELLEEKNKNERLKESYDTDTQALKNQVENVRHELYGTCLPSIVNILFLS